MVQDPDRSPWRRFLRKIGHALGATPIIEVSLQYSMTADSLGNLLIDVFGLIGGKWIRIPRPLDLFKYGFTFRMNGTIYGVSRRALEPLLAIGALNPQTGKDGRLVAKISPSILKFLRTTDGLREDPTSKQIEILDRPPEPGAEISYNPKDGVHVRTGYHIQGLQGLVPLSALQPTPEKSYARIGQTYLPTPQEADPKVTEWLRLEERTIPLKDIPEFFARDLVLLRSNFKAVLDDKARAIKVHDRGQVRVEISTGEPGWLDFQVNYIAGEYVLPWDVFRKAEGKYVQVDDFDWVKKNERVADLIESELRALGAMPTPDGFRVEIARFPSLEDFIQHIGGVREVTEEYRRFLDQISDFRPDDMFQLPKELEQDLLANDIALRPYQRSGIQWLEWMTTHHLHAILADDMGLGKTIEMIAAMRLAYSETGGRTHSLVVSPKSVVRHWTREILRVFPQAAVHEYIGQDRDRRHLQIPHPTIFVTTYDTLSRDVQDFSAVPFLFLVLDEGTKIKNPDTARARAVKRLNAAHRFVLSGVPIENRPAELWSIFDFLMPGHLGSYGGFVSRFESPIVTGGSNAATELAKRIRPFILRRLKEQVARDLPEKIEMEEWCSLTEEQRALYAQLQERYASPLRDALLRGDSVSYTTSILPVLTKLKQVCDHPALITRDVGPILGRSEKFDLVVEKVQEALDLEESSVVFTYFLGTLDLLERQVKGQNVNYIRIDGSTQDRQALIDRFNRRECVVALCSLMAGGYGINLTSANHVVHVDRWWNPAIEDQATDRVHRIGQTKTVYVHKLLVEGTLEEKIAALLEKKRGIADQVIGAATREEMQWTREELIEILAPIDE